MSNGKILPPRTSLQSPGPALAQVTLGAHGRQLGPAYTNFHQETGARQGQAGLGATGGASASPSRGAQTEATRVT